jgi:P27 family predicted phage terminase small subunit
MKTGRPPIPSRIKALKGTLRADRRNLREPQPQAGAPTMPSTLPNAARPAWRWLARLLAAMRVLTKADGPVLVLASCRYADYTRLRDIVERAGETYTSTTAAGGQLQRQRPEVTLRDVAWRDLMQALQQLGLTPSARQRVSVTTSQNQEMELETFLGARH